MGLQGYSGGGSDAAAIVAALGPFPNQSSHDLVLAAATTGNMPPYNEPSCGGTTSSFNVGAAIKNTAISSVFSAVPVVGGLLGSIFGGLGAHHAAAVKTEQATLCKAVPDAANFLAGIDELVRTGQLSVTAAPAALDQGLQNWRKEVSGILKDSGGSCNAACVYEKAFMACIAYRKQLYAGMVTGNTTGAAAISAAQALGPTPGSPQAILQAAGFTSGSQNILAIFIIGGASLIFVAVAVQILRGVKKQ